MNNSKQQLQSCQIDVSGRFKVSISEIISIYNRKKEINSKDINDIDFLDDNGDSINIDKSILEDFRYTGLNNIDFIITGFYKIGFES